MNDDQFTGDEPDADIGISANDAQAIKQTILTTVKDGFVETGDCDTLAADLIEAFKNIDAEVFRRETLQKSLTAQSK